VIFSTTYYPRYDLKKQIPGPQTFDMDTSAFPWSYDDPLALLNTANLGGQCCTKLPMFEEYDPLEGCSHCHYQYTHMSEANYYEECAGCGTWCRTCCDTDEGREAWPNRQTTFTHNPEDYCKLCSGPVESATAGIIQDLKPELPEDICNSILGYLYLSEQATAEVRAPPRVYVHVTCRGCGIKKSRKSAWVEEYGDIITCYDCMYHGYPI
jgi:hypothetical protein